MAEFLLMKPMISGNSSQSLVDEPGVDAFHGFCMTKVLDIDGMLVLESIVQHGHQLW
jgi:hypothetical protein